MKKTKPAPSKSSSLECSVWAMYPKWYLEITPHYNKYLECFNLINAQSNTLRSEPNKLNEVWTFLIIFGIYVSNEI